jgi:hypothetical protein
VREDKFTDQGVKSESPDTLTNGKDKDSGGRVQAVASAEELVTSFADIENTLFHHFVRVIHVFNFTLLAGSIDAEDRTDRDTGIDVGRAIQRIENNDVVTRVSLLNKDGGVFLLRGEGSSTARRTEASTKDLVRNDIELLLVLTLDVGLTSKTSEARDGGAVDHGANLLASSGDGGKDSGEFDIDVANLLLVE